MHELFVNTLSLLTFAATCRLACVMPRGVEKCMVSTSRYIVASALSLSWQNSSHHMQASVMRSRSGVYDTASTSAIRLHICSRCHCTFAHVVTHNLNKLNTTAYLFTLSLHICSRCHCMFAYVVTHNLTIPRAGKRIVLKDWRECPASTSQYMIACLLTLSYTNQPYHVQASVWC